MAGTIKMTPDDLRQAGNNVESKKDSIVNEFQALENQVNDIKDQWEGSAQTEFFVTFEQLVKTLKEQLEPTLDGIRDMLNGAAQGLEEADEAIASAFKI